MIFIVPCYQTVAIDVQTVLLQVALASRLESVRIGVMNGRHFSAREVAHVWSKFVSNLHAHTYFEFLLLRLWIFFDPLHTGFMITNRFLMVLIHRFFSVSSR